jgi:glycosyltransferase involved in cell wall biosynthesis
MGNGNIMRTLAVLCDRVGDDGGAERYWETVLPGLLRRGIRVQLLARFVSAGASRFGTVAHEVRWGGEDDAPSAAAAQTVAEALRAEPPDAILTANVFDTAVLDVVRAAGPRWLVRLHDHRAFCPTGDRVYPQFAAPCGAAMGNACRAATLLRGCVHGPRASSFERISAREAVRDRLTQADGVVVASRHMHATCRTNGVAEERIAIAPSPLPDDAFADRPAEPNGRSIVFAGRLTPRKGLCSLVRALGRVPAALRPRLVVAGEGAAEELAARAEAARLGVTVEWLGRIGAPELRRAIDDALAVAVPSLWPEPFGLVGIEAQARGRPAVAYRVGGIEDWIADAGIAVRRGDEAALAEAIRSVLDDQTWSSLASKARTHAEAYRLDVHLDRLLQLCEAA